jgi:hypothetical protein
VFRLAQRGIKEVENRDMAFGKYLGNLVDKLPSWTFFRDKSVTRREKVSALKASLRAAAASRRARRAAESGGASSGEAARAVEQQERAEWEGKAPGRVIEASVKEGEEGAAEGSAEGGEKTRFAEIGKRETYAEGRESKGFAEKSLGGGQNTKFGGVENGQNHRGNGGGWGGVRKTAEGFEGISKELRGSSSEEGLQESGRSDGAEHADRVPKVPPAEKSGARMPWKVSRLKEQRDSDVRKERRQDASASVRHYHGLGQVGHGPQVGTSAQRVFTNGRGASSQFVRDCGGLEKGGYDSSILNEKEVQTKEGKQSVHCSALGRTVSDSNKSRSQAESAPQEAVCQKGPEREGVSSRIVGCTSPDVSSRHLDETG